MSVYPLSAGAATHLNQAIASKDTAVLEKMLDPRGHRSGRHSVLFLEEEKLIEYLINFIASRGFAMDARTLGNAMEAIAADDRRGYENSVPSANVVRAFRTHNRDISFRNAENKDQQNLRGENYYHVETYASAL